MLNVVVRAGGRIADATTHLYAWFTWLSQGESLLRDLEEPAPPGAI
jgi:hypothetical protein